ncbi:MAG: hypothetical protein FWE44_03225 [Defluviitaleaceae bacterium]|nr:hypothetical protein [Defluviitaleaceae bacterium]
MATYRTANYVSRDPVSNISRTIFVRWYEVAPENLEIHPNNNPQLQRQGTNASFFGNNNTVSAFHSFRGAPVANRGHENNANWNDNTTGLSSMHLFAGGPPGHAPLFTNRASNISQLANVPSNISWAIGGVSLFLNENVNGVNAMTQRIQSLYTASVANTWVPNLTTRRARTFIAFNPTSRRILFGIMSTGITASGIDDNLSSISVQTGVGATYFDMHNLLRTHLGCTMGLSLDGGGTTRILTPTGAQLSAASDPRRSPVCQISFR